MIHVENNPGFVGKYIFVIVAVIYYYFGYDKTAMLLIFIQFLSDFAGNWK
jgi:hypothetical protein